MNTECNRPTRLELQGRVIGRWTVLQKAERPAEYKTGGQYWLCRCACGTESVIQGGKLNAGRGVKGCHLCRGHGATKGGLQTPEYRSWRGMKERCNNSNHSNYRLYGARGISVCARWLASFDNFLEDMGPRPTGHSLDRIDVNGNYTPENCRWADSRTQATNTRTHRLTDEQKAAVLRVWSLGATVTDLAEITGMSRPYIAQIASEAK